MLLAITREGKQVATNIARDGKQIADNERYVLTDIEFKNNEGDVMWTYSRTVLKCNQSTRGHKHDDQDEIYRFKSGSGKMQVGGNVEIGEVFEVAEDSIVYVPAGRFHRVFNFSSTEELVFDAIFPNSAKRPTL